MKHSAWRIVLICVASLAALGRITLNSFADWDDQETLSQNPRMNPPTLNGTRSYWKESAGGLYVPVTYTAWSALSKLSYSATGRLLPAVFHTASIVTHMAAACVAYFILVRLLSQLGINTDGDGETPLPRETRMEPRSANAACIGAILFAIHPIQVEAVAWASGFKDILAGFFALLAVLLYIRSNAQRGRLDFILATVALILAMLSKPSAIVVPLLCGAIDLLIIRRPMKLIARSLALWFLMAIPILFVGRHAQEVPPNFGAPLWQRPMIALDAIAFYLWKLVLPINLTIDYGRSPRAVFAYGVVWYSWIAPAILATLLLRRAGRQYIAAALLFVFALLPTLGLMPFQFQFYSTNADHYLYLPMLAISLGVAIASRSARNTASAIPLLAILGALAFVQAGYWRTPEALFAHALEANPQSAMANNNIGTALAANGDFAKAIPHFLATIRTVPADPKSHRNLARCYAATNNLPAAIEQLDASIILSEQGGQSPVFDHKLIAKMQLSLNRDREAIEHLRRARQLEPSDVEASQLLRQALARSSNHP